MPYPSTVDADGVTVFINVKQSPYGATGNGTTNDTTAIAAALSAANSAGGGTVFFPAGTYITTNQTLYANVHMRGAGINATIIKLKNATNADLFSAQTGSINLSAASGVGAAGSLYNFGLYDLTLDGNLANQSSGTSYPLRFYGYGYILQNLRIKNGYTGSVLSDWNGGAASPGQDAMEAQISNVKIHDCNGIGLQMGGPHDTQINNLIVYNTGSHGIHIAPNCTGMQVLNTHVWNIPQGVSACGYLIEAATGYYMNCVAEKSDGMPVALLATECQWDGHIVDFSYTNATNGIQLGQAAGNTPYPGMIQQAAGVTTAVSIGNCMVRGNFDSCGLSHGAVWFANTGGGNMIQATCYQTSGTAVTGTPHNQDSYWIYVKGLTPDGTLGKSGGFHMASSNYNAFNLQDAAGTDIFNIDSMSGFRRFEMPNGTELKLYSDAYSTTTFDFTSSLGLFLTAVKIALSAGQALYINDGSSDIMNFNTANKRMELVNGPELRIYSGNYSSTVASINADTHGSIVSSGNLSTGQSATTPDPGGSGTVNTANIGVARVTPASSRAGCILQAGTVAGQDVWVVNNSASNTISWATQATSHISGEAGGTFVLAAKGAQFFKWDSVASLWYKAS